MGRFRIWALILAVGVIAGGCARQGLILRVGADSSTPAIVVGDARAALAGGAALQPLRAELFRVGFGEAGQAEGTGTARAIFWGGTAWVDGPDGAARAKDVQAAFAAGIPRRVRPAARYDFRARGDGLSLAEVYEELAARHGERFVVAGAGTLSGWPGSGGAAKWAREPVVFVAAVTTNVGNLSGAEKLLFLEDPRDTGQLNVRSYTVAARTERCPTCDPSSPELVEPVVLDVDRVLSQSLLLRADLVVYEVEGWQAK